MRMRGSFSHRHLPECVPKHQKIDWGLRAAIQELERPLEPAREKGPLRRPNAPSLPGYGDLVWEFCFVQRDSQQSKAEFDPRALPRKCSRKCSRECTLRIFSGYFLPFTLQGKNTLRDKNNLGNVNFILVLKGIFGASLKTILQNENSPQGLQ